MAVVKIFTERSRKSAGTASIKLNQPVIPEAGSRFDGGTQGLHISLTSQGQQMVSKHIASYFRVCLPYGVLPSEKFPWLTARRADELERTCGGARLAVTLQQEA